MAEPPSSRSNVARRSDVERDLERDWKAYQYRGDSTWQQIKDAVRDAWDRVTGQR